MQSVERDIVCNNIDDDMGPTMSHNISKVLEESVEVMIDQLPATSVPRATKERVKRPMNAFMVYSQTARKAVAKYYPNLSYRKLSKALGKIWGVMDSEEKKPFINEAERLRQKHKQDYPDYKFKAARTWQARTPSSFLKEHHAPKTRRRKTVKTDNSEKSSSQIPKVFSTSLNRHQKLSFQTTRNFRDTATMPVQQMDFAADGFESANSGDFRLRDKVRSEEGLVPLLDNILNGAQEILQRESSATKPTISPTKDFQPPGNTVSFKDSAYPALQGVRGGSYDFSSGNGLGLSSILDVFNWNEPSNTSGLCGTIPTDLVNFCDFITTEKQEFDIPILNGPQNNFGDTASVFVNF